MNDKDQRLIAALKQNARYSISDLARLLQVSRTTVQQRLTRLEESGVISGYSVRLGEIARADQLQAYVNLVVDPQVSELLVTALKKMEQVETVFSVSGKIDFIAILTVQSARELDGMLDQIGNIAGVRSTETAIVLSKKFDRR